jgi:Tol biopolymer transport system component
MSRRGRYRHRAAANRMPAHAHSSRTSVTRGPNGTSLVRLCLTLLTLFLVLGASVGCQAEDDSANVASDLYVPSAADHYEEALDRAMDWKRDAYLISICGDVVSSASTGGGGSITFYFDAASAPNSMYQLDLAEDTWTPRVIELGSGSASAPAIQRDQWTLDSVDAWSIAQANGGEEYLLRYRGPTMMNVTLDYWTTRAGDERLAWRVLYYILHGSSLDMLIDPKTGDIIEVEERSESGTLVATTPTLPSTRWAPLPVCTPATAEPGRVSGLPERIAFACSRDGLFQVYLMDPDGLAIEEVTDGRGGGMDAVWSPDGQRIAFASGVEGKLDVYVMYADGSNLVRLTDDPANDGEPAWSPDGGRIAFSSDRDGNYNIYIMDADGSNLSVLTDHPSADESPDWSPDGCRMAFVSARDHWPEAHVYVVNVDGSNLTQLTDGSTLDYEPRWSPDGTRIAFWSQPIGEATAQPNVYVMDEDGAGKVRLTTGSCGGYRPVWSPDGTRIAFSIGRDEPFGSDIFVMDSDGSNVIQLTDEPGHNIPCSWRK